MARYRSARRDRERVVLEGFHALKHALRFGAHIVEAVTPDVDAVRGLARRLAPDLEERLLEILEPVPGEHFLELAPKPPETGVLAIARRPAPDEDVWRSARGGPVVLLDRPRHPGNLGAAIRVAAAAGAAAVGISGSQDPWHPAAVRGSAGLHFALPVLHPGDVLSSRRPLVALDPEAGPLLPEAVPQTAMLAFGSEREGLSGEIRARADLRVSLPMRPGVSSLNLASSVAAVLYLLRYCRRAERRGG